MTNLDCYAAIGAAFSIGWLLHPATTTGLRETWQAAEHYRRLYGLQSEPRWHWCLRHTMVFIAMALTWPLVAIGWVGLTLDEALCRPRSLPRRPSPIRREIER